ncbi:MAG: hypothetical protein COA78_21980 [Blastopirellula sp.]|nr:MAG: hypothetical protein COA78_21980 [Blastopirellula sp.]
MTKMGRPTKYTEELAIEICNHIGAGGLSLLDISKLDGMPSKTSILSWINRYDYFLSHYVKAQEQRAGHMSERIVDVAFDDNVDPAHKRIQVDTLKWLMSKQVPKRYGDKIEHTNIEGKEAVDTPTKELEAKLAEYDKG